MRRKDIQSIIGALAVVAAGLTGRAEGTPYTHLNFLDDPEEFHFAIWSDMYGADEKGDSYRDAVRRATEAINLMRPEFVMSIGDLIPFGWTQNEENIREQHRKLNAKLEKLVPPFFCCVGNHDISPSYIYPNGTDCSRAYETSSKVWEEFRGKPYYSFVHKNVLFVVLNCQDDCRLGVRYCGISKEQYDWFKKTLDDNANVRWTCVFMHLPQVWTQKEWLAFEKANLVQRKYTVFAGDWHNYIYARRHGHDYYVLSVCGGCGGTDLNGNRAQLAPRDTHGEMDHIMWVTMTKEGPKVVNLDLNGIVAHDFVTQATTESMGSECLGMLIDYPEDKAAVKNIERLRVKRDAIRAQRRVDALRAKRRVKLADVGADPWDATAAIRKAIGDGGATVVFDRAHSPWVTGPIAVPSNTELVFEEGAELLAKAGDFREEWDSLLTLDGSTNVVIRGEGKGATLRMRRTDYVQKPYSFSEHRHAVNLLGAGDVRIENLRLLESGGDGVYVGAGEKVRGVPCRNVKIDNCDIDGNHRQAISVISVNGLVVANTRLANTCGTLPMAGIDFEPNGPDQELVGCVLTNCTIVGNRGYGVDFYLGNLREKTKPVSIRIEDCLLSGNSAASRLALNAAVGGSVSFARCRFDCSDSGGFALNRKPTGAFPVRFEACEFVESATRKDFTLFSVHPGAFDDPVPDDFAFVDCTIRQPVARPWIRLSAESWSERRPKAWTGAVTLVSPAGTKTERLDTAWIDRMFPAPKGGALQPLVRGDYSKAKVRDAHPGELTACSPVAFRDNVKFVLYAAQAGKVRVKVRFEQLAGYDHHKPRCRMSFRDLKGKELKSEKLAPATADVDLSFDAPAAGFYTLDARFGDTAKLIVKAANVPIAADSSTGPQQFIFDGGTVWFPVKAGARVESFLSADGGEYLAYTLKDGAGVVRATESAFTGRTVRLGGDKAETMDGLWSFEVGKPTKGRLRKWFYHLRGIPGDLFLSSDRLWIFE